MKKRSWGVLVVVISSFVLVAGTAFAQSYPSAGGPGGGGMGQPPGVFGQVAAINGATITITDSRNSTTYTIDASNASVTKNGSASSLSNIAVGDTIIVQGMVSGNSVTATSIMDGFGGNGGYPGRPGGIGSSTRPINASGTPPRSGARPTGTPSSTPHLSNRPTGTPSGTPPFASGTFPGYRNDSSSSTPTSITPTSTVGINQGFFGSVMSFFANLFSFFKL